jgi:hypothetical protein
VYENPSAGEFEPPPPASGPAVERSLSPRLIRLLLVALIIGGMYWLEASFPGRGWTRLVSGVIALGLGTLDVILKRKRDDAIEGKDPYSPPTHITR